MARSVSDDLPQGAMARITGAFYLAFILASVIADQTGHIGLSGADKVFQTLTTSPWMFRLGLVFDLLSAFLFLMAAWGLYVLLRPVNRDLALLFLLLNVVGVGVQCASAFPLVLALLLGDGASRMQAFSAAQLHGLAYLNIGVYKTSFITAQLFFGTWLFPLGYLVYKSRFLPRTLGVLLILDGFAVMIWFLQALLLPAYPVISYPGLAISFVAEVGLALWLLIMGVKAPAAPDGAPA